MKMIKVLLMHQTVTSHDAIGNDIESMFNIINELKFPCKVYAENKLNKKIDYISKEEMEKWISEYATVIIYHHSVFWEEGENILHKSKCRIIFRYHNITPASFFEPYNKDYYFQCEKGRKQTLRFVNNFRDAFWLSDSKYNNTDLKDVDEEKLYICAPFHKIDTWSNCKLDDTVMKKTVESKDISLLFVGRVAPNKGHLFLLEILRVYLLNYNNEIKLRIIGKFDDALESYNKLIEDKIKQYKLEEYVEFVGEINDSILASYYLGSDFFVCASEHEGFCVPILEAQKFGLPIITLNSCAIPDTGGKGQILLDKEARKFAAAINVLYSNKNYYTKIQKIGFVNYKKYEFEFLKEKFVQYIKKIGGLV